MSDIDDIKYTDRVIKYTSPTIVNVDWRNILKDPPKNSSKITLEELLLLSQLTANRSSEDLALIKDVDEDAAITVKRVLKKHNHKFPQDLFDKFYTPTKQLIINTKLFYNRPRPAQLAKVYNVKINVIESNTAKTPSYPSGHTVYAELAAELAKNLYPHLSNDLDIAVKLVGYARMAQGVHFPSDNKASIILGNYIYNNLNSKIKA